MTDDTLPPIKTFTVDALEVRIYSTAQAMARAAAAEAWSCLQETIASRGRARMILASANSQIEFLDALVAAPGLDWSRVTGFHMDEYLGIGADHPASFRRFLRERVAERVPLAAMHYLAGDCLEPFAECDRYADLLAAEPVDLCCLGIGENGHLAFNDPPVADFQDARSVKLVKLDEACRAQQVGEGHFPNLETVPQYALTLTIPQLGAARRRLCIVPDQRKARAVKMALEEPVATTCPASFLRRQPRSTLFLDAAAASLL